MYSSSLEVCLLGAGRIGAIHADNIARQPDARLRTVFDPNGAAAAALAEKYGARVLSDPLEAINDPAVGAVLIASPTPTHVDFIVAAAKARKPIFCEKPIDLDLARVDRCLAEVQRAGVPLFIGFNRRFDPSFRALREAVRAGEVGKVEAVTIISRDPRPPPLEYLKSSGGIFRDMTIHDFDMARWLLGEEPTEVYATGSCLVDPEVASAGDVDSAMIVLKTASGALCHIQNSRRAAYGYDQRLEVFGEKGMLQAQNVTATRVVRSTAEGTVSDKPLDFFLERYEAAYRLELRHFLDSVRAGHAPEPGPRDGRQALVIADAALESLRSGKPVRLLR